MLDLVESLMTEVKKRYAEEQILDFIKQSEVGVWVRALLLVRLQLCLVLLLAS